MTTTGPDKGIFISSIAHPDTGAPACLIEAEHIHEITDPDTVLNTARELATAAACAEIDVALMKTLRALDAPDDVLGAVISSVREARPPRDGKVALRIQGIAGYHTMQPYVHVTLGSVKGELTPDGARQMAQHWTEIAVGVQFDARLRYVLGELPQLNEHDVARVFAHLRRAGNDQTGRTP